MCKFSIVTATYNLVDANRVDSVRRAAQSLWAQTNTSFEHIFQDGGSNDGTLELLNELAENAPANTQTQIFSEPDSGLYEAMNRGIEQARGDYIILLNSDDAFASEHALASIADANPSDQYDFVFGTTIYVEPSGEERLLTRSSLNGILQRMPFCQQSLAIKNDVYRELKGFDLRYRIAADYDFNLRLVGRGYSGRKVDTPLVRFEVGGASSDIETCADEHAHIWKQRFAEWIDMSDYGLEDCKQWYLHGNIPRVVAWRILRSPKVNNTIRRAAWHSLNKTVRRDFAAAVSMRKTGGA